MKLKHTNEEKLYFQFITDCMNRVTQEIKDQEPSKHTIHSKCVHTLAVALNVDTIWIRNELQHADIIELHDT